MVICYVSQTWPWRALKHQHTINSIDYTKKYKYLVTYQIHVPDLCPECLRHDMTSPGNYYRMHEVFIEKWVMNLEFGYLLCFTDMDMPTWTWHAMTHQHFWKFLRCVQFSTPYRQAKKEQGPPCNCDTWRWPSRDPATTPTKPPTPNRIPICACAPHQWLVGNKIIGFLGLMSSLNIFFQQSCLQ